MKLVLIPDIYMKKILIYGGSFSPPHVGHAITIETALRNFPCDELWLLPSPDRYDKKMTATAEERCQMLELIIQEAFNDSRIPITISQFELENGEFHSTYATYQKLQRSYPAYDFGFLFGTDVIADLMTHWRDGAKLATEAEIVAYPVARGNPLPDKLPAHFNLLDQAVVTTTISSTFIRNLLATGHSGLPNHTPAVAQYIREHSLYKNEIGKTLA